MVGVCRRLLARPPGLCDLAGPNRHAEPVRAPRVGRTMSRTGPAARAIRYVGGIETPSHMPLRERADLPRDPRESVSCRGDHFGAPREGARPSASRVLHRLARYRPRDFRDGRHREGRSSRPHRGVCLLGGQGLHVRDEGSSTPPTSLRLVGRSSALAAVRYSHMPMSGCGKCACQS